MSFYKIVSVQSYDGGNVIPLCRKLEEAVELLIGQGWSCIGGVVIIDQDGCVFTMHQTMIKLSV